MQHRLFTVALTAALALGGNLFGAGLSPSPWPMIQGGPQHLGRSDQVGPARGVVHWVYSWPGANEITSPAVGTNGIYFATDRYPIDGDSTNAYLVAVGFNGTERWRFTRTDSVGDLDYYPAIRTVPAVTDNEHVWFSSYMGVKAPYSRVFEIDQNGAYVGYYGAGNYAQNAIVIDSLDGIYYCRGNSRYINRNLTGYYAGYNRFPGGGPALSPDEQTVYIGTGYIATDQLLALHTADMTLKWAVEPAIGDLYGVPLVEGTNIYFSTSAGLVAVADAGSTGVVRWVRADVDAHTWFGSLAMGFNGRLYAGEDSDGTLYCLDPLTGTNIWKHDFGTGRVTAPLIDANGHLYVGFADTLYKMQDSGSDATILWQLQLSGNIQGLAMGKSPWLYATTLLGNLYCLGSPLGTLVTVR